MYNIGKEWCELKRNYTVMFIFWAIASNTAGLALKNIFPLSTVGAVLSFIFLILAAISYKKQYRYPEK